MLNNLTTKKNIITRSVSAENFTGEKGKGGMATEGTGAKCARDLGQGWKISPSINIPAHSTFTLCDIHAMGAIKHIWIVDCNDSRSSVLRMYWEGSEIPSVEAPLADFFCDTIHSEHHQISSLAVCVNPQHAFNCYWEMPFRKECKITLENITDDSIVIYYQIDYEEKEIPEDALYFHAQFRRVNPVPYKEVYTILDNVKGRGHYVGTYLFWGSNNNGWWGEGEIKFYLDGDEEFPTICGTGTEDYFCGGYGFHNDTNDGYLDYTTPYGGFYAIEPDSCERSQFRFGMYRWHICDPIYFDEDIKVTIQALGWRRGGRYLPLQDDISSVAFWYQEGICDSFPTLPDADYLEMI